MSEPKPEPKFGERSTVTKFEGAPVSRAALWGFGAVAVATLLALLRDAFTVGIFGLPTLSLGSVRYAGLLLPVLLILGIVLGHLAVRKRNRHLRHWRIGIAALVLGYGFLLLYLAQIVVLVLFLFLLSSHPLTF